jgi:GTPase Era involved in 16S rRNA processing
LPGVEKDYQSVAIIGVQNSGKSTLLNNLFGTNFEVLTRLPGERTTLGIWVSLDK